MHIVLPETQLPLAFTVSNAGKDVINGASVSAVMIVNAVSVIVAAAIPPSVDVAAPIETSEGVIDAVQGGTVKVGVSFGESAQVSKHLDNS